MVSSAPRIDFRLVAAAGELDRKGRPIAETNRLVGAEAARLGLPKPSYEQVRQAVHRAREGRRVYRARDALVDVSFRVVEPQQAVYRLVEGERRGGRS